MAINIPKELAVLQRMIAGQLREKYSLTGLRESLTLLISPPSVWQ